MILVDFLTLNLQASLDQYCITADISLASEEDYVNCELNSDITITVNGTDYILFVENKNKSVNVSGISYTLNCVSPTVKLDSPYHETIVKSYDTEVLASTVITEMASYADITVDYQAYDWLIASSLLLISDMTPLYVIRKITEAIGAVIQTKPNGDLLIISKYPVSPKDWATSLPTEIFTFEDDIIDYQETMEIRDGYNAFVITDNTSGRNMIYLREKDIEKNKKWIKGFRIPFDDGPFELKTSGGSEITIEKETNPYYEQIPVVEDEGDAEWEVIEFIDWTGTTDYPIYEIIDYQWIKEDLGEIDFREDGTLSVRDITSVPSESLLRIKYLTKYWKWKVTGPYSEYVQFYVEPLLEED